MKTRSTPCTLSQLENEIYRLRLEASSLEEHLGDNVDHLQKHYASMTLASLHAHLLHKEKEGKNFRDHIFSSVLNNATLNKVTGKIVDKLIDKAAQSVEDLINQLLHSKKQ